MKVFMLAAIATVGLPASMGYAGEGQGNPFPFTAPAAVTRFQGHQALPNRPADPFPFRADDMVHASAASGGLLPSNGSEGAIQTANSLPRGFENGTPAYVSAQIQLAYQQNQERARKAATEMAQAGTRRPMADRSSRTRPTGPG